MATATKTRFLAGWTHTSEQQVLRVDDEPQEPLPERVRKILAAKLRERVRRAGALLVSDYGFGAAAPEMLGAIKTDCRLRWTRVMRCWISSALP